MYALKLRNKNDKDDDDNHKGGHSNKTHTSVVAFKQKGGDIKAFVTENTTGLTLGEIIFENIEAGSEIHTDEYSYYRNFKLYYKHKTVNHSLEYVSADGINTNSIEGFWSLLKRGIKGQFHHISKKYLQCYVTEFEYRYNGREIYSRVMFGNVLGRLLRVYTKLVCNPPKTFVL